MIRWTLVGALLVGCGAPGDDAISSSLADADGFGDSAEPFDASLSSDAGPGNTNRDASPDIGADADFAAPPIAYITTDDLSLSLAISPITLGDVGDGGIVVTLDPGSTYQSILGFGASVTDSSSYVMTTYLSPTALASTLTKLFDPKDGIGLNFLRQPMGASDFSSIGNFSYDDGNQDLSLTNFNIDEDLKATVPILKQTLAISPSLFILGTPWSPPAWMKINGSMDGTGSVGSNAGLLGSAYAPLGNYFVRFIQAYASEGITVDAIAPQNEPLNGSSTYPGMDLDAPSELSLIAQDIGPDFADAGITTLVWAYDHNWDVESYPEQIMADPVAGPFTEGAAFHCYAGDASAMTTFHDDYPNKSVYLTECSGGTWQSDPFANTIDLEIDSTNNWARSISLWNLALDEDAGPMNDGCNDCRGVITVNSQTGDVTFNVDYFALGHFSKFVHRGAVRIASTTSDPSLNEVAFQNPDGTLVLVAHNTGANATTARVGSGASAMNVSLPANAALTLVWTP